jgi:hypothetical protein
MVAAPWTLASDPGGEAVEEPVVQDRPLAVPDGVGAAAQAGLTGLSAVGAASALTGALVGPSSSVAQADSARAPPIAAKLIKRYFALMVQLPSVKDLR